MIHVSMMLVTMMHVSMMLVYMMIVTMMHVSMMHVSMMLVSIMHLFMMHVSIMEEEEEPDTEDKQGLQCLRGSRGLFWLQWTLSGSIHRLCTF